MSCSNEGSDRSTALEQDSRKPVGKFSVVDRVSWSSSRSCYDRFNVGNLHSQSCVSEWVSVELDHK